MKSIILFWAFVLSVGYSLTVNSINIRPVQLFMVGNTTLYSCFPRRNYEMCQIQSAKWKHRACFPVKLMQYDGLYCCNLKRGAFQPCDKNSCNCFYNIQTSKKKSSDMWKSNNKANFKSINILGKSKHKITGRKLLQEYIHENNDTQFTSYESILLKVLVLLLIVFTFFAILISTVWLLSVYVLKRLKIQNALNSENFFVITEL